MPKKGRRKRDDDQTDDDIDDDAPARKNNKKECTFDDNGTTICELSKNRKVSLRMWQGKRYVDICEFYIQGDGKLMPGKKGISLPLEQWKVLSENIEQIREAIAEST